MDDDDAAEVNKILERPGREPLRVFIREENKKLNDTIRKLEERIINLEKLIG
jgi:hypothetical protein